MSVGPFRIESESEADDYLTDLFKDPKFRSMAEVKLAANEHITDPAVLTYFYAKAEEMLRAYSGAAK